MGETVKASRNKWDGVWINLMDDLYYGSFYRDIEKLGVREYLRTYARPKTHAIWSGRDPAPFIVHFYKEIRKALGAVLSRTNRDQLQGRVQGMPVDFN